MLTYCSRQGWNNAYQYNLRLYQARVHSYKIAGNPDAKHMTDEDALQYAEANNIPLPHLEDDTIPDDQEAIAEQLRQPTPGTEVEAEAEAETEAESTEEAVEAPVEAPAPPSKTPKKSSRKRKSEAAEPEPAKSTPTATAAAAVATPDTKKRRRTSKAAEAESSKEEAPKRSRAKKARN